MAPTRIRWDRLGRWALIGVFALVLYLYVGPLLNWVQTYREAGERRAEVAALKAERARLLARERPQREHVAPVAKRSARSVELAPPEQGGGRGPGGAVLCRGGPERRGLELRAHRDQLCKVSDCLHAPDVRYPDEDMRIQVVTEQKGRVAVGRREQARASVMGEVPLVDRLDS